MRRLPGLLRFSRRWLLTTSLVATAFLPTIVRAADGTWQELIPITPRPYTAVIYDGPRDRLVVVGGLVAASTGSVDVWSMNLTGPAVWTKLVSDGLGPGRRVGHSVIFDTIGDRLVMFGGEDPRTGVKLNDAWVLNLAGTPEWTGLSPLGTPPAARSYTSAVFDSQRRRMVVFGGTIGASSQNDVWELSLSGTVQWTQLSPTGTPPAAREAHVAVYDPIADRMVVFGGLAGSPLMNDTWALSFGGTPQWTQLTPVSPPQVRAFHGATYDAARNRMLVFGGTNGPSAFNDVWALTLTGSPEWSLIGGIGSVPDVRYGTTAAYDVARDRLLIFGGWWQNEFYGDVAALTLQGNPTWTTLWSEDAAQQGRSNATAIYDPVRSRMWVFGGINFWGVDTRDLLSFALSSSIWSPITAAGPPPPVRHDHSAIYDPVRDRMLVFGGSPLSTDLWSLALAGTPTWSLVSAVGGPSARSGHTAIYDPVRDRMIVFGGGGSGGAFNDVWAVNLAGAPAWGQLGTSGTPPSPRFGATAIYDPSGDRMIVFGGIDANVRLNETWQLTLSGTPTWSQITPATPLPPTRFVHTAVYDGVRSRMVVFGGNHGTAPTELSDVWALDLGVAATGWSQLSITGPAPLRRYSHVAITDVANDRMIVSEGYPWWFSDTWQVQWPQVAGSPTPTIPLALTLGASAPNPSTGRVSIPFGLPSAARVRITVLDLQGRVIRTLVNGEFPAGAHFAHWDGRLGTGARAPSGVYLYRLDALGANRSGRLVIAD